MTSQDIPRSKAHLLQLVEPLSYNERAVFASELGKKHRNKPELRALVDDLLNHPAPVSGPEMDTEDGFTELLPPQRTSIYKYYTEDQLALSIATAAGMFDIFKERLKSPSAMFDAKVIGEYVSQHEKGKKRAFLASDDEVVSAIVDGVPARRKLLIQACVRHNRLSLFDAVIPALRALPTYPIANVANIIHLCSSSVVQAFLEEWVPREVCKFHWDKLARFHSSVILSLLRNDLSKATIWERSSVWTTWYNRVHSAGWDNLIKNNKKEVSEELLDLVLQYYPATFVPSHSEELPNEKEGRVDISIPSVVENYLDILSKLHPKKITQIMIKTIMIAHGTGYLRHNISRRFISSTVVPFERKMEVIAALYAKSTAWSFLHIKLLDYEFFTDHILRLVESNTTTPEIVQLIKFFTTFFTSIKPTIKNESDKAAYRCWVDTVQSFYDSCFSTLQSKEEDVCSTFLAKIPVKTEKQKEKLKKDMARYSSALALAHNTFFPWLREAML